MGKVDDDNNIEEAFQANTGETWGERLLPAKYPSQVITAGGKVQACSRRPGDGVSEIWTDVFGKWCIVYLALTTESGVMHS